MDICSVAVFALFQIAKASRQDPESSRTSEASSPKCSEYSTSSEPEDFEKNRELIESIQKNYEKAAGNILVDFDVISSIVDGHKHHWEPTQHPRIVINFIQNTQGLIIKFLEKNLAFQSLDRADRTLLFNSNAHYFGMLLLANYLTADSGYEQFKGPKGLFSAFHLSVGRKFSTYSWYILVATFFGCYCTCWQSFANLTKK